MEVEGKGEEEREAVLPDPVGDAEPRYPAHDRRGADEQGMVSRKWKAKGKKNEKLPCLIQLVHRAKVSCT